MEGVQPGAGGRPRLAERLRSLSQRPGGFPAPVARARGPEPAAPGEGVSGGLVAASFLSPCRTGPRCRSGHGSPGAPNRRRRHPGPMQSRLLLLGTPGSPGGVAARRVRLLLRQVVRGRPGGDGRPEVRLLHAGAGAETGNPGSPRPARLPCAPCAAASPCLLPGRSAARGAGTRRFPARRAALLCSAAEAARSWPLP